jgi:prolyl-tRNA editing enzyme YbaK/EbsC (Cys-tRNA(Pro) deacylase)
MSTTAQRFQEMLASRGNDAKVVELPSSTRTAAEAAAAIGCSVAQIAKSIVFRMANSQRPVIVVASGVNRVDEARVAQLLGEPIEKADAAFVREKTGFVIGGVPPMGHAEPITTLIDEDLFGYAEIWAAAGTPNSVFRLTPAKLLEMTAGVTRRIK